jgi:hypothetical protein
MRLNVKFVLRSYLWIACALFTVLFNEFLVYWFAYFKWPQLHNDTDKDAVRLLLVADPQLIGDNDEPWYYKAFSKWDSDRYLRNTYILAHSYVKPDVTVFLGDLFDEGLKATDQQYEDYFTRFKRVFDYNTNHKNLIYISGDNDIGGESLNDRNDMLSRRFIKYFVNNQTNGKSGSLLNLHKLKHLSFLTLDLDYTYNLLMDKFKLRAIEQSLAKDNADPTAKQRFLILLNHMSIVKRDDEEIKKVVVVVVIMLQQVALYNQWFWQPRLFWTLFLFFRMGLEKSFLNLN